ncbi:MAG: hypothetical protein JOZ96_23425 [Acidobacteria bacterium]|nr:hypothetical protein [Acidobacteriota bacterium]
MSGTLPKLLAALLLLPQYAAAVRTAQGVRARDCGLAAQSLKLDEYGDLSAAEEGPRLEKFTAALKEYPDDTAAFIVAYAGRAERAGAALRRADRAKQAVIDKSPLLNPNINTLDCGRRESPAVELWLTPVGASPPRCSPTLDPAPPPPKAGAARRGSRRS